MGRAGACVPAWTLADQAALHVATSVQLARRSLLPPGGPNSFGFSFQHADDWPLRLSFRLPGHVGTWLVAWPPLRAPRSRRRGSFALRDGTSQLAADTQGM